MEVKSCAACALGALCVSTLGRHETFYEFKSSCGFFSSSFLSVVSLLLSRETQNATSADTETVGNFAARSALSSRDGMAAPADWRPASMNPRVNTAGFTFNLSPAQKEVRRHGISHVIDPSLTLGLAFLSVPCITSPLSFASLATPAAHARDDHTPSNLFAPARICRCSPDFLVPPAPTLARILLAPFGSCALHRAPRSPSFMCRPACRVPFAGRTLIFPFCVAPCSFPSAPQSNRSLLIPL